ncbi:MAG TPA: lmo0937 family membrane protein [Chthonomonadaceae bacterium]|nr:lmo0937 family membrane protein [Chthonomonadaceae bacterium]
MAGILWTIIVILFIFWLLGFLVWNAGGLIHLLLVVAVIMLLFNLFTGRRTAL